MTEQRWVELPDFSDCWGACNQQGGQCSACMNADPDALAGYCCSGANHHGGGGAVSNGDCPADAATAVTVDSHACVVLKEKTPPCAILYDGINQTGTSGTVSTGEDECCNAPHMPLFDAAESVYVTPATGSIILI